jgi:hypothetical protein
MVLILVKRINVDGNGADNIAQACAIVSVLSVESFEFDS